ncbi:NUDIX hydrolase [Peribacillus kribbensis]|uniref:NUDIX hydrolase n=1 Tax=Peribacillus kribbensis TaxID=356658 RepID=UPI00041FFE66|nr:CoA pyrophosphatase [Peribacillus kribbensis]
MEKETIIEKVQSHTPVILGSESFSKYSVLIPLVQREDELHVVFEVRSMELRRQPGEVCFPGGRIDPCDHDEKNAAIRETVEELGIARESISQVMPIDFLLSPYGMIVYPFTGFIDDFHSITPNSSEVGEIFTVPLSYFLNTAPRIYKVHFRAEPEEGFPMELLVGGENYQWRPRQLDEYFYLYKDRVIWGLTARILSHFTDLLKK